ncbi:hypothetical protein FJZ36_16210 [Candidatus Poribacteria bacterium]|nr:hypothetical protein [Candidatus Poribacteria bacterium]
MAATRTDLRRSRRVAPRRRAGLAVALALAAIPLSAAAERLNMGLPVGSSRTSMSFTTTGGTEDGDTWVTSEVGVQKTLGLGSHGHLAYGVRAVGTLVPPDDPDWDFTRVGLHIRYERRWLGIRLGGNHLRFEDGETILIPAASVRIGPYDGGFVGMSVLDPLPGEPFTIIRFDVGYGFWGGKASVGIGGGVALSHLRASFPIGDRWDIGGHIYEAEGISLVGLTVDHHFGKDVPDSNP